MKNSYIFSLVFLTISLLGISPLVAQNEIHYSMFYNAPLTLSPGLTSVFNGDNRFIGNYRSQWRKVPVPYTTVSLSYDQKIYPKRKSAFFYGAGANLNYDFAGDGKFTTINLNLLGSFTWIAKDWLLITPGVNIGVGQRSLQSAGLNFNDQWNGDEVVLNPSTGEKIDLGSRSFWYPDFGGGLNFRFQKNMRTRVDLGGSINHLNKPRMNFYDGDKTTLPNSYAVYIMPSIQLANPLDIMVNLAYKQSSEYKETLIGAIAKLYLNTARGKNYAIGLGMDWRTNDAWIPTFELYVNNWKAGVSYDINNSSFNIASDKRGGLEVSLQYILAKVKPLENNKFCPVY